MLNSRGSAELEAALIIPLVILIIAGMINRGCELYSRVVTSSESNAAAAQLLVEGGKIPTESIIRGRWHIKKDK